MSITNALPALMATLAPAPTPPPTVAIPASFESQGADRRAIKELLATYARAVSIKDRALFETLLLDADVPFSGIPLQDKASDVTSKAMRNYQDFRHGVFEGAPFSQRFRDVRIDQDGPLAQVSLVFVNTSATGSSWGWKTLQLLKVAGRWKIASEFYTGHKG